MDRGAQWHLGAASERPSGRLRLCSPAGTAPALAKKAPKAKLSGGLRAGDVGGRTARAREVQARAGPGRGERGGGQAGEGRVPARSRAGEAERPHRRPSVPGGPRGTMAALLLLLPLLLLPLLLLRWLPVWPRLRWLAADLAFAVRAVRCKRALRARLLAAAKADPRSPQGGCSLAARLEELARRRPARTFLRHGARSFSYAEAERRSNRAARAFLRARGWHAGPGGDAARDEGAEAGAAPLTPGATVALLLPSSPEFLWLWFGLAKAGLRAAFVPSALRRAPLLHCLRSCGARALVLAPGEGGARGPRGGAVRMGGAFWRGVAI